MSQNPSNHRPEPEGHGDLAVQLASRFMALVKSGNAWSLEHVGFTQQLENYIALLDPVFRADGRARFDAPEGDLCLNGALLPFRKNMHRAVEQFPLELAARSVEGLEFTPGLTVAEMQAFMHLFLRGERWKGEELVTACNDAGVVHVRALPLRSSTLDHGAEDAAGSLPETLGASRAAWAALFACAEQLLSGNGLDHGVELRHLKRAAQPLVDSVLAGERITAALADVAPGETVWAHAAHVALAAVSMGARLGLGRHDLANIAVAALLHDVGHAWAHAGAPHTQEGVRRIAWATTFNQDSLAAMRVALEHEDTAAGTAVRPALISQLVGAADAYITYLSRGASPEEWVSPSSALVHVLESVRAQGQRALGVALVRALGFYPPGQLVELDDGAVARTLVPVADDPERPWIQLVADERGTLIPGSHHTAMLLPEDRLIARALPRNEWPAGTTLRRSA